MKKTALIAAFTLASFVASAQTDTARLIVRYKFSHIRDTTSRDKPYTENMILFAGQNASVYKSYDRSVQSALIRKQMDQQLAAQKGQDHVRINVGSRLETTTAEYLQYPAEHKLLDKENLFGTQYLIEQPMPAIKWNMSADTMTIGGLHCQKATAHFKGRDYTAWFAPDLPFHAGPWKLNGLPGLIVEAYDKNNEVVFKFDGMEEAANQPPVEKNTNSYSLPGMLFIGGDDADADPNVITPSKKAIRTTQKEFDKVKAAAIKDPNAFMKAMTESNGGHFSAAPDHGGRPAGPPMKSVSIMSESHKTVVNNPIELPEKP